MNLLIIGSGHLAYRIRKLAISRGHTATCLPIEAFAKRSADETTRDAALRALRDVDLAAQAMTYVVDDRDERNLELIVTLVSIQNDLHITASFFNENIAPHLRAAHPNVRVLNPAKLAAPAFVAALTTPVSRSLRYAPAPLSQDATHEQPDRLIWTLLGAFAAISAAAVIFFHVHDALSWIDATYFVVVTIATVGYGDINLANASGLSKAVDIVLILSATVFIWMIFSLTIDRIIKRRVQLALGRKRYALRDHVIVCGLGRLGFFIAEELLARGERVLIVEHSEHTSTVEYFRSRGAQVYIGDARLPRVLQDAGVGRAQALFSVVGDDYTNLETGLNARSIAPGLRLVLRIFDESMAQMLRDELDIHLSLSMSAVADAHFLATLDG